MTASTPAYGGASRTGCRYSVHRQMLLSKRSARHPASCSPSKSHRRVQIRNPALRQVQYLYSAPRSRIGNAKQLTITFRPSQQRHRVILGGLRKDAAGVARPTPTFPSNHPSDAPSEGSPDSLVRVAMIPSAKRTKSRLGRSSRTMTVRSSAPRDWFGVAVVDSSNDCATEAIR